MNINDIPTERRITYLYRENPLITKDDLITLYRAFDKLLLLRKAAIPELEKNAEMIFHEELDMYQARMRWLNEFLQSRGYPEGLFRNIQEYRTCVDDYDYYYELKTYEQVISDTKMRYQNEVIFENVQKTEPNTISDLTANELIALNSLESIEESPISGNLAEHLRVLIQNWNKTDSIVLLLVVFAREYGYIPSCEAALSYVEKYRERQ